ncbi:MAG: hypothetical protein HJHJAOHD_00312 [Flavobacteriales bacterium]|nr:hypothetical protein [Flavobacteriales bacterium]
MKNDNLFELINSLNKSERRDFVLYSKKYKGDKKYLLLFHELCNGKNNQSLDITNINYERHRLYNQIQKCFSKNYDSNESSSRFLQTFLFIKFLLNKRLLELVKKEIINLKKACYNSGKYNELNIIIDFEILNGRFWGNTLSNTLRLINEKKVTQKIINNIHFLENIAYNLFDIMAQIGTPINENEINLFHNTYNNISSLNINEFQSETEKLYYYRVSFFYYTVTNNFENAFNAGTKVFSIYKKNKYFISEFINQYVSLLHQLIYIKAFDDIAYANKFLEELKKTKKQKKYSLFICNDIDATIKSSEIAILFWTNKHKQIIDNEEIYFKYFTFQLSDIPLNRVNAYAYFIAQSAFLCKEYEIAKKWIELILKNKHNKLYFSVYFYTFLMLILTRINEEKYDVAELEYVRCKDYLISKKQKRISFEFQILKIINILLLSNNIKSIDLARKCNYLNIKENIISNIKHPKFLIKWLDEKIN